MYFGEACGRIIRRVLEGELTLECGLSEYGAFVEKKRAFFEFFSRMQAFLTHLPLAWVDWIARVIEQERIRTWVFNQYWGLTKEWEVAPYDEPDTLRSL